MKLRKLLFVTIIIMLILSTYSTVVSISVKKSQPNTDDNECYIIQNVPYVGQKEVFYCEYAAIEIVLRYYGLNLSQIAILYISGGAYSAANKPRLKAALTPPIIRFPHKMRLWTAETTGGTDDYKFLAQLYGLKCKYIFPEQVYNHEECWEEYWETVKSYVKNDVPVVTGLDPTAWPPYQEAINLTFTPPKMFGASHIVVVIGYNETNGTVCVNDPGMGYFNMSEGGIYRWIELDVFKKAVGRIKWEIKECRYQLLIFENTSDPPLPEEQIAQLIHERNVQKTKGIESAYDQDFITEIFKEYGIDAIITFKNDLKDRFIRRIPLHKFLMNTNIIYSFNDPIKKLRKKCKIETYNKMYISEYLQENKDINPYYERDAILLEKESQYWRQLYNLSGELYDIVTYNNSLKAMKLSRPIINEMVSLLDDVITIKKMIITDTNF